MSPSLGPLITQKLARLGESKPRDSCQTQNPGPAPCPRSAGCRSGYRWVHPCFLFAFLSNLTGSWLAGRLAQAHPGDPSAPPKSCCGVLLRLCQGLGCTAGTQPAARSLPETPPMARSPGSHFCVNLFLVSLGTRLHEMLPKTELSQATESPTVL